MAKITIGPLGTNYAVVPKVRKHRKPPKRLAVRGWTEGAARRNKRFLQSVDPARLDGIACAFTLTVKDLPETPERWRRAINAFRKRLTRKGCVRYHWVVEWQKRGHPHLHGIAYFDCRSAALWQIDYMGFDVDPAEIDDWVESLKNGGSDAECLARNISMFISNFWQDIAWHWRAYPEGQHVTAVTHVGRWSQYLSKHAARGADHYQRQRDTLPSSWQSSGRLWGRGGDWPTDEQAFETDMTTFFRFRRMTRRWYKAKALDLIARGDRYNNEKQVESGQSLLRFVANAGRGKSSPNHSRVKGLSAHMESWVSERLLVWAADHPNADVRDWVKPEKEAIGGLPA